MSVSTSRKKKVNIKKNVLKKLDENEYISYEKFHQDILLEKMKYKEQQIYDLETKIKAQEKYIDILNKKLKEKDINISTLIQSYKFQLSEFIKLFGFKRKFKISPKEEDNSYKFDFTRIIQKAQDDNKIKDLKIEKLKEEIKQIERENNQLKLLIEIKKNDEIMVEIYKSLEKQNKLKKEVALCQNDEKFKIKDLIKKNNNLEKKIVEIKKTKDFNSNIIKNFPYSYNSFIYNGINTDINIEKKQIKKELEKIKEEENRETQIIINKYINIIEQNKKEIINRNIFLNKIDDIYIEEIKKYEEELIRIFNLIQNFINIYYKSFYSDCSLFLRKEDCDKFFEKEFKQLNLLNFPLLYKELNDKKEKDPNKKKKLKIFSRNINVIDCKKIDLVNSMNYKEKYENYSIEEIISEKNKLFSKIKMRTKEELKNLTIEELVSYLLSLNNFLVDYDNFINKYICLKNKYLNKSSFDLSQNQIKNIKLKTFNTNSKIKEMALKQQQSIVVMESSSKVIQKLKEENIKLSERLKHSMSNGKSLKIPNLKMKEIKNNNLYLKKSFSNNNIKKNNFSIYKDTSIFPADIIHIIDKYNLYKLKIK